MEAAPSMTKNLVSLPSPGRSAINGVIVVVSENLAKDSFPICEPDDMVDLKLGSLFQEAKNGFMQLAVGQPALSKRALVPSCDRSPNKLLVPLPALFKRPVDKGHSKKIKIPTFPI